MHASLDQSVTKYQMSIHQFWGLFFKINGTWKKTAWSFPFSNWKKSKETKWSTRSLVTNWCNETGRCHVIFFLWKEYFTNLLENKLLCQIFVFRVKVHIFWEGHKILRNLHQLFDWQYIGQIIGGDFAKFCGLLRIYEL